MAGPQARRGHLQSDCETGEELKGWEGSVYAVAGRLGSPSVPPAGARVDNSPGSSELRSGETPSGAPRLSPESDVHLLNLTTKERSALDLLQVRTVRGFLELDLDLRRVLSLPPVAVPTRTHVCGGHARPLGGNLHVRQMELPTRRCSCRPSSRT